MSFQELKDFDYKHIWHPYTSPTAPLPVFPVVSGEGVRLTLADGRTLIDGMSSWWCAIHGYNHPALNAAAIEQINTLSHVMFGGITHPPAVQLTQKLIEITPDNLQKVFYCDSGSVAVEVAIKMAIQYWYALEKPQKSRLLTIRSGYHGDTFGAMAVCDPVTGMHHIFQNSLVKHFFADAPQCQSDAKWNDADLASFKSLISGNHHEIAAVILEPIVQGAGGMRFYAPEFLRRVRKLCDEYDVLLILDEIATGFGRTGKLFACEHAQIAPDIMCVGKAITGGYMSFGATMTTDKVAATIGKNNGVFMHGPTFMGNPLACAVAHASIDLLLNMDWQGNIVRIEQGLYNGLKECENIQSVKDVRVLGAIGVVEMDKPVNLGAIQQEFVDKGVWVRPFGALVYLMPPYIINNRDLKFLTSKVVEVIKDL